MDVFAKLEEGVETMKSHLAKGLGTPAFLKGAQELLSYMQQKRDYERRAAAKEKPWLDPQKLHLLISEAQGSIADTSAYSHGRQLDRDKDKVLLEKAMLILSALDVLVGDMPLKDFLFSPEERQP